MAFDDPVVWLLIIGVAVIFFGSSKIPQLARALGQARKEFDNGWKGVVEPQAIPAGKSTTGSTLDLEPLIGLGNAVDPLIIAAKNEGIETEGKTKEQIASEIAWKLNKN